jgi:enoyl-CoA hydratase/carnithine racemase
MALVGYCRDGNLGVITIDRPSVGNAFDDTVVADLDDALVAAEQDTDARAIIIRATGPDFCLGADMAAEQAGEVYDDPRLRRSFQERLELERRRARRWEYVFNFQRPTVAAVQGRCVGPGLYLALSCDVVVAADDARFGEPAVRMGHVPAFPPLIYLVGYKKAKEYLYLGWDVSAQEAEQMGMINRAVPAADLEAEVLRFARALALPPSDGMVFAKESLNSAMEARGLGAAWRFATDVGLVTTAGPSDDTFDFFATRTRVGAAAAVAQRDQLFADLGL